MISSFIAEDEEYLNVVREVQPNIYRTVDSKKVYLVHEGIPIWLESDTPIHIDTRFRRITRKEVVQDV